MRGRTVLFSAVLLAAGVLPAFADQTATPADATQTAAPAATPAAAEDPIVCRQLEPETGTRLGARRICMHQSEWDRSQSQAKATLERVQQRSLQMSPPGG